VKIWSNQLHYLEKVLETSELKYNILEKQSYAMVKALKYFRTYVLHSKKLHMCQTTQLKISWCNHDSDGKRRKWLAKIQGYDLEIKPTKLIKGQGLARLLTESNLKVLGINNISEIYEDSYFIVEETDIQQSVNIINEKFSSSKWYQNIIFYLQNLQCPPNLTPPKTRSLKLKAVKYCIINEQLY
jgi:hypothetical protein